jgi:hypothetical protein
MLTSSLNKHMGVLMKCHVNETKFLQKYTRAKCNKFHTFRQQLLLPSSGIGNGYSNSFESVGKPFHLDFLPNGFSFLDVKQNQTSRCNKTLINISHFPPFNVPTKQTNSTSYYNSHFTRTCFGITMPYSSNTSAA